MRRHPSIHPPRPARLAALGLACVLCVTCSGASSDREPELDHELDPQLVFWDELQALCGRAYEGRLVTSLPPDESFAGRRLLMHVHHCDVAEVRVGFHVGDDRSRTWVVTPTSVGLRLTHDHRHEDGSEDAISGYGGETEGTGTPTAQDFPADRYTAELVPTAETNVWTLELHPDSLFAYALRREAGQRRFRVEFDLAEPVAPPPPPWGAERR